MSSSKDPIQQLKTMLSAPTLPAQLLIIAPDRIRRERVIAMLVERYFPDKPKDAPIKRVDAERLNPQELSRLADDLNSLSLFTKDQLYIIENIGEVNAKIWEGILNIVSNIPPVNKVIITGAQLLSTSRLFKHFSKSEHALVFDTPEGPELKRWVQKELKSQGLTDYPERVFELLQVSSTLMAAQSGQPVLDCLSALVERLSLFVDGPKVTEEDLDFLFQDQPDPNEFELIEALTQKNVGKIEGMGTRVLRSGKNSFMMLGLLSNTFSSYLSIRFLLDRGVPPGEIRRMLNLNQWRFDKQIASVKCYSLGKLKNNLQYILKTDSKLKNRALDPENIISDLLLNLAV